MTHHNPQTKQKKGLLGGLFGGGSTYMVFAIVAALAAVFAVYNLLSGATATTTYYVLNQSVAARTQITTDMLTPVQVGVNSKPPNAYGPSDVASGNVFALIPLKVGDVVSGSDAGSLSPINKNIPANFVVTSFSLDPKFAVAGKLRTGDYIDIIATNDSQSSDTSKTDSSSDPEAKVVLHHVLIVDVTTDPASIQQAATSDTAGTDLNPGPESDAVHGGIPELYTVALSAQDATTLALVVSSQSQLTAVLSSSADASKPLTAETDLNSVFDAEPAADSGAGTSTGH